MYIVIWEVSSTYNSSGKYMIPIKTGKSWMKFDSKQDADKYAENLKKTNRESGFFSLSEVEVFNTVPDVKNTQLNRIKKESK